VKAVSDIYSPVSGEVVEVNEKLAEAPETVNKDPHGEAWLAKIRVSAPGDVSDLLSAAEYESYIAAEK
jgi:glycine cleavage system H protein